MSKLTTVKTSQIVGLEKNLSEDSKTHQASLERVFRNNSQIFIPTVLKLDNDEYFILNLIDEFRAYKSSGHLEMVCLVVNELKGIHKDSLMILFQNILKKTNSIRIAKDITNLKGEATSISNELGIPLVTVEFYRDLLTFDWNAVTRAEKVKVNVPDQLDLFS
jgi:hypothetical protein